MSFGLAGAHRTGKTTLAKQVAEDLGYSYHNGSVSAIMREFGIDAVGDIPLQQRIEAQEFLLGKYLQNLHWAPRPMITDRTPLDMIGYMLGEVTMHNTDPVLAKRIDAYVVKCLEAALTQFDTIVICRPLTKYVVDAKSPPLNPAFQSAIQFLIEGACRQVDDTIFIQTLMTTDFQTRRAHTGQIFKERLDDLVGQSKKFARH
jgi:hypothetical protein